MFAEDDLLPLSALQHLLFCPRQCALIHLEGLWVENTLTLEGKHLHTKADSGKGQTRDGVRTARGLALRSLRLGISGKADVVEFHRKASRADGDGTGGDDSAGDGDGDIIAFPVEYKRGRPKRDDCDLVQLCAQALCLEEMLGAPVPAGALFYGQTRRRLDVHFDAALRRTTETTIARLHEMIASRVTPRASRQPKCERCSLLNLCLPDVLEGSESASRYLRRALAAAAAGMDGAASP